MGLLKTFIELFSKLHNHFRMLQREICRGKNSPVPAEIELTDGVALTTGYLCAANRLQYGFAPCSIVWQSPLALF